MLKASLLSKMADLGMFYTSFLGISHFLGSFSWKIFSFCFYNNSFCFMNSTRNYSSLMRTSLNPMNSSRTYLKKVLRFFSITSIYSRRELPHSAITLFSTA